MDFKYTTKFDISAQIGKKTNTDEIKATLEDIREKVIPKDLDLDTNTDLLPIAFNAFVANSFNLNDDGVSGATAKSIAPSFINKPINIEHDRDSIVGFITNYNFTSMEDNEVLSEKEVDKLISANKEFNVALGGVIWRIANNGLAELLIETNDEKSDVFMAVSASWELGFGEFQAALIEGDSRSFSDATFVNDEEELKTISSSFRSNGGSGKVEGKNLYREVIGSPLPLGIGLTENPAAKVQGVATLIEEKEETKAEIKIIEEKIIEEVAKAIENLDIFNNKEEKVEKKEISSSHKQKINVNRDNKKIMDKPKSIQEITPAWLEESCKASGVDTYNVIMDYIREASSKYEKTLEERAATAKTVEEAKTKIEESLKTTEEKLAAIQTQFDELNSEKLERVKQDKFDERMASFEGKYELSDEDRKAIANSIKDLSEEEFETCKSSLSVFLKSKEKETVQAKKEEELKAAEELKKKQAKASKKEGIDALLEKALSNGKKEEENIGASTNISEDQLAEIKEAFGIDKVLVK